MMWTQLSPVEKADQIEAWLTAWQHTELTPGLRAAVGNMLQALEDEVALGARHRERAEENNAKYVQAAAENLLLRKLVAGWVSRWLAGFLDAKLEDGDFLAHAVFDLYPGIKAQLKGIIG